MLKCEEMIMADRWKVFEQSVYEYVLQIKEEFKFPFDVIYEGKENSAESDVVIKKDGETIFTVEAKLSPARGGQFVVFYDEANGNYTFSENNRSHPQTAERILKYLNDNPDIFGDPKKKVIKINPTDNSLKEWVIKTHKDKKCKFIVTSKVENGYKAVISIDDAIHKFIFGAMLRKSKKSGSRDLSKSLHEYCEQILSKELGVSPGDYKYERVKVGKKNKTQVTLSSPPTKDNIDNNKFCLSSANCLPNRYFLRKKGETSNATVEFSLRYNGDEINIGRELLIQEFRNHL